MVSVLSAVRLVTTSGSTADVKSVHSSVSITGQRVNVQSVAKPVHITGQRAAASCAVFSVNISGVTVSAIPVNTIVPTISRMDSAQSVIHPVHPITS